MKQIQLVSGRIVFENTVSDGVIDSELLGYNVVDDLYFDIHTEFGTYTFDFRLIEINGQQFNSSEAAVSFIQNL